MPSPYDPSTYAIPSSRGSDALTERLQRAHDKASQLMGIKGEVRADDQQHAALVRALLGIGQQVRGGR